MPTDYIELTTQRLRQFADYEAKNPPESGVVRVVRDPHGAFWKRIAEKQA